MSGGVFVRVAFVRVVFVRGGFCPYTHMDIVSFVYQYIFIIFTKQIITMSMSHFI